MKKIFILSSLIATTLATPSFAAPTELDKKTVASKAYVDTKQDIIETGLVEFEGDDATINVPSVVTTNVAGTGLSGNQIGFMTLSALDSTATPFGDFAYGNNGDNFVPSAALVASRLEELSASVWDAMPVALSWIVDNDNGANRTNAINAYNSTFGNGTNNWAGNAADLINGDFLARSLALKQNKIETGLVELNGIMLPAITTYDSTSGLVANKIGILNYGTILDDEGELELYGTFGGYGSEMDNYVPTVRAVAEGLAAKQIKLPAAWTSATNPATMASTGGQTIALTTSRGNVRHRYITAGGSQSLTQKAGADNVILYINGTKTLAQYQTSNFGAIGADATTNQNYINGALVSLELLKDVYSELNAKITNNALPTGTAGTVVTYNGVNAETGVQEFGERAVYDPANTYNASTDATKLATMASVKYECAGYEAGHENDPDYCWLWALPN